MLLYQASLTEREQLQLKVPELLNSGTLCMSAAAGTAAEGC